MKDYNYFSLQTSTDVDETKKRAIFLSVIGPKAKPKAKAYAIVRNLTAPVKPVDVSYAELIRTVKNIFNHHLHR